jgi:hypothetical protein
MSILKFVLQSLVVYLNEHIGDNSLRRFRDQEIHIEHELCFPRCR